MTINERVFHLLEIRDCSQKSFCDKTGISNKTVSAWKTRKSDPPANLISTIAEFFNVSSEYLLLGNESTEHLDLKPDEQELLNLYGKLDSRGRHRLHTVAYEELDRIDYETHKIEQEKSKTG